MDTVPIAKTTTTSTLLCTCLERHYPIGCQFALLFVARTDIPHSHTHLSVCAAKVTPRSSSVGCHLPSPSWHINRFTIIMIITPQYIGIDTHNDAFARSGCECVAWPPSRVTMVGNVIRDMFGPCSCQPLSAGVRIDN